MIYNMTYIRNTQQKLETKMNQDLKEIEALIKKT